MEKKKYKRGYVSGVFDMFHIGHLNLLRRAKEQCEYLLVGVVEDNVTQQLKGTTPRIAEKERLAIVQSIRFVDEAFLLPLELTQRQESWKVYQYDVAFSGNDREGNPVWEKEKEFLRTVGSDLVYFPYTPGITSTALRIEQAKAEGKILPEALPDLETAVSFVIPTYNGGDFLGEVLRLLTEQEAILEKEILLVDSGSADGTVERARELGAYVVEIPNEKFSHWYARNLGIQKARGEYVILMTQDAMPTGKRWARTLLEPVVTGKAAGVSPLQVPQLDAPLFEKMMLEINRRSTRPEDKDVFFTVEGARNMGSVEQFAALDNVSCAAKKETLKRYPFRARFGEDRDVSRRLLRDGHTLGLLASVQVRHSHNRPASYHVRRAICHSLYVQKTPGGEYSSKVLCGQLIKGYLQIKYLQANLPQGREGILLWSDLFPWLIHELESPAVNALEPNKEDALASSGDAELDGVLNQLAGMCSGEGPSTGMEEMFANQLRAMALPYFTHPERSALFEKDRQAFLAFLLDMYAHLVGTLLGQYPLTHTEPDALQQLVHHLEKGV